MMLSSIETKFVITFLDQDRHQDGKYPPIEIPISDIPLHFLQIPLKLICFNRRRNCVQAPVPVDHLQSTSTVRQTPAQRKQGSASRLRHSACYSHSRSPGRSLSPWFQHSPDFLLTQHADYLSHRGVDRDRLSRAAARNLRRYWTVSTTVPTVSWLPAGCCHPSV